MAVPLFSRLAISRRGLYSQGGVAPTWWHLIDECSACMKLEKRIRQTAGEESEEVPGQQKVSSWLFPWQTFGIDFFRFVMCRMTRKAEISDSAVQRMTVLREPIQITEN